jgi:quinolinate synthase
MTLVSPKAGSPAFELASYKPLDDEVLQQRIAAVRTEMGPRLLILGHHYQQDEVIAMSDLRGDSYQLSKMAAESGDCRASDLVADLLSRMNCAKLLVTRSDRSPFVENLIVDLIAQRPHPLRASPILFWSQ